MSIYDEMQDIARDVLGEFRQEGLRYIRVTPGTGPKDDPGPAVVTPFDIDAAARGVAFKYVNGSTIVTTDLQLTMAVRDDVTPDMHGFVEAGGKRCKVIAVQPIPPTGVTVAHVVIFRK